MQFRNFAKSVPDIGGMSKFGEVSSSSSSLTSIFFQDESRVWTAASQQHKVDNQPLATLRICRLVKLTLSFRENLV